MLGYHGYYTYYIHWASKFATSANIGNKAAYHIHWLSKLATSANKCRRKTSLELKPLQKSSRNDILGTQPSGKMLSKLINFLLFGAKILERLLLHHCIYSYQLLSNMKDPIQTRMAQQVCFKPISLTGLLF